MQSLTAAALELVRGGETVGDCVVQLAKPLPGAYIENDHSGPPLGNRLPGGGIGGAFPGPIRPPGPEDAERMRQGIKLVRGLFT